MFFHFPVLIYSLIFYLTLKLFSSEFISDFLIADNWFWIILAIIALLGYFYEVGRKLSKKANLAPMSAIFTFASIGMLYFVQSAKQQTLLIVLTAVAYYFIHMALYRLRSCLTDQTAQGIIAAGSVATIFLFYAMSYGIYLNFAISIWILMIALMIITTMVSYQYFWMLKSDHQMVLNYSLVLGLVMAELIWVLNFWPFGYLTTGVVTLIFYYVFWDLVQCHFNSELSKRRVVANMVFFGLLVVVVLTSTRWLPVV